MYDRVNKAFVARIRKIVDVVGHADLTASAVTQTITSAKSLPPGASIVGVNLRGATAFSGGSVSALLLDIGNTADPDCIVDGADLFATVVDGNAASRPNGIAPNKFFAAATALKYLFTATGDNVVNLTAGSITIEILYSIAEEQTA